MRYNLYLKRGLLVGPGVTNSACKQTVGNRHQNRVRLVEGERQRPVLPQNAASKTCVGMTP